MFKLFRRKRGFNIISEAQFNKDFKEIKQNYLNVVTYNEIRLPKRATAKSMGYDLFNPLTFTLEPNEDIKIPTGISAYMKANEGLKAYPRSGHGFKYYIRLANSVGLIDADYNESDNEGHIWIKLRNEGNKTFTVNKGEAICQLVFEEYLLADGDNFKGKKRNGGFGSTDK